MQIPENIKLLSAYDIGQLLHKKKLCPIDLVNFYYSDHLLSQALILF